MKKRDHIFTFSIVISLLFGFAFPLFAQEGTGKPSNKAVNQKIGKLQIPFIANEGQADKKVAFYANTFGGTVFVTNEGEIVYALPKALGVESLESGVMESEKCRGELRTPDQIQQRRGELHSPNVIHNTGCEVHDNHKSCIKDNKSFNNSQTHNSKLVNFELQGVALKETLVGAKVKEIKGEDKSATKINYFKGNDQKKWKSNISTYDVVDLGEVYNGIELKLKAYGNNVEKLFHVKPGADPDQIKISLSGIQPPGNPPPLSPSVRGTGVCPPLAGVGGGLSGGLSASGLWVNEQGQLVAETALGPVTFTKPMAYQEIDGKRVNVEVEYIIENAEYRKQKSEDINQNAVVKIQQCIEEWHMPHLIQNAGYWIHDYHESCLVDCESCIMSFASDSNSQTHNSPTQDTITPQLSNSGTPQLKNPEFPAPDPQSLIYGFKVASYDTTKELVIDPLLASTFLGGSYSTDVGKSLALDTSGNIYVTGSTWSSNFPTTSGAYDTSSNGNEDVFVSKLDSGLTSLLASTYMGGSYNEVGYSLTLDTSGNVYVTGWTESSNFPTTSGTYDTSNSDNGGDAFVSKLDGSLTNLLASTYLGGSSIDSGNSLSLDTSGNVYVTGYTQSTNFPTTIGAYDTTQNGSGDRDVFVSKLDGSLMSLLASTYVGGASTDYGYSIALGASGNVYVTGFTWSTDYPTTSDAYDNSQNGNADVFVSKLDGELTSLLNSTYLGGSGSDISYSLAIDTSGNVYVTGSTMSSDFPAMSEAYDTSNNGGSENVDIFVSKLDGGLTYLLASTYLGGSSNDYGYFLTLDTSGNVYVTGCTKSSDFPTTSGAYDTTQNGSSDIDVFVSKLDSGLTGLLASTFLGGSAYGYSLVLDTSGNVYVTGDTSQSNFPTTSGAYDTSYDSRDGFISKLDGDLSASPPTVTTGNATNVSLTSTTLNGTVNANDRSTTVWFEYGLYSGLYDYSTSTKTVSGSSDQTISINISNLYADTKYYYRIVAESDVGTTYGDEMSFTTLSDTSKPSGSISINSGNDYTNSANVTIKLSASDDIGVTGYYISTSSSTPSSSSSGWTDISSTTNYSTTISYTLDGGDGVKTIYVWYKDDAGNVSDTYSDSITLDTTPPEINITSPTTNDTYSTTISVVSVWGNASDATGGISTVKWENNKGGSGTASGTTNWSISNIGLLVDAENIITVTATDNAGNSASDAITVTYSEPTTEPTATTTPTPIQAPTSVVIPTNTPTPTQAKVGVITGTVVDTEGKPIANATVLTDRGRYSAKTGSDGLYQLNGVAEGDYTLTAFAEGYGSVSQTVTVKAGETTQADFTLLRAATIPSPVPSPTINPIPSTTPTPAIASKGKIFGYVTDEYSTPVKSAKVRCKGKNTGIKVKMNTDKQGYFEFNNLDADTYKIVAKKKGYYKSKYTVNLKDGEEKEIEMVLEEK